MTRLFISFEHRPVGPLRSADEQSASGVVFEQILARLRNEAHFTVSDPAAWESYGWYVEARAGNATLTCMIQRSDKWLIQIFLNRSLVDRMMGVRYDSELRAFALAVAEAVHEAFGVAIPAVQNEAEFLR